MGRRSDGFNRPFAKLEALKRAAAEEQAAARRPAPRPSTPAPAPARSEEEVFLSEMAGTRPLEPRGRVGAPPPEKRVRLGPQSEEAEVLAELADLCDGSGPFDIADTDEYVEGIGEGIDRRLLKRLRAGEYAVQAHLDLHGLGRDAARDRLAAFIADSRRASRRCVLIVHGRGLHSKDQIPVLKQALRSWLERGALARSVLAFATARPCDGGAGALYVLLRR